MGGNTGQKNNEGEDKQNNVGCLDHKDLKSDGD